MIIDKIFEPIIINDMFSKFTLLKMIVFLPLLVASIVFAQEFPPPATTTPAENLRFPPGANRQQKREIIQQRLQAIQNRGKVNIALGIFDRLGAMNTRRTAQFQDALDKMNDILFRLTGKVDQANTAGLDTTNVQKALNDAQNSLDTAQAAVQAQADKEYVADATNEADLRLRVGQQISQLQSDLREIRALLIDAKQKIAAVIRELAKTGAGKIGQRDQSATSEPALFQPLMQE